MKPRGQARASAGPQRAPSPCAMKLTAAPLGLCVALFCSSAAAFFVGSAKHVAQPVTELESGAEAAAGTLANPLGTLNLLKLLLTSLGIPVNHLVEGSQKCVAELGPEALGAVKSLLGVLTMFG
ncbi:PREDICTED: secretoglobin family 3A member 1 [Rhinopithecus bieti]|nr:PREDICTED: secretoglobin family 3A member 1 [Rhinopithecus bieti]